VSIAIVADQYEPTMIRLGLILTNSPMSGVFNLYSSPILLGG